MQPAATPSADAERRTLADALGALSDDELAALFAQRPDLTRPLPEDLAMLARQATTQLSVRLAWLKLNQLEQQVLRVLVAHGRPVSRAQLLSAMDTGGNAHIAGAIDEALAHCLALALVWEGDDRTLRPVAALASSVGPAPCGLEPTDRGGHPLLARYLDDPKALADELLTAPPGAREALDRLLWGPPRGGLPRADRPVSMASAQTPVEWLLARGLLLPDGPDHVVLPREVALALRGGRYVESVALPPPPAELPGPAVPDVEATGGMHALATARTAGRMLKLLDEGGTRVLRTGGVYQRDAAELARRLQLNTVQTALLADLLLGAGLIARDEATGLWCLTRQADVWRVLPEPRQWSALMLAWRDSPAQTSLVGTPDAEHRILSEGLQVPGIAEIRRQALAVAAQTAPGRPIDPARLAAAVAWRQPRLDGRDLPELITELLQEAEHLGLLGRGAMTTAARLLADRASGPTAIAEAVAWPSMVDRVIVQADLTATAPGPLAPLPLARIELLADQESAGAGTVYRISAASLQRAFDAGMSTSEVAAALEDVSLTGVPSTLSTLISDVGRRHGAVRVAAVASVVTCDDDAVLTAAIAAPALAQLHLHRVASGVAISTAAPAVVTAALRKAGIMAVAAQAAAPRPLRVPAPAPYEPVTASPPQLQAAVRGVRAGTEARRALTGPDRIAPAAPHELVDLLQSAIRDRTSVWLDVTDATGTRRVRQVQPLTLRSGLLSGYDQRERRVLGFPLSRIAGIAAIAPTAEGTQPDP